MAGRHRLEKQPNWTLRATIMLGIALSALTIMVIAPLGAGDPAPYSAQLAAVSVWEQKARLNSYPISTTAPPTPTTTVVNETQTDSGRTTEEQSSVSTETATTSRQATETPTSQPESCGEG